MAITRRHLVIEMQSLEWPVSLTIPSERFRLLLVGDRLGENPKRVSDFAERALACGMVYICCWGEGCELVHDLVDEARDIVNKLPEDGSVVMSSWHDSETLEEVAEFFTDCTLPGDLYIKGSEFWLAICVNRPREAAWFDTYLSASRMIYEHS